MTADKNITLTSQQGDIVLSDTKAGANTSLLAGKGDITLTKSESGQDFSVTANEGDIEIKESLIATLGKGLIKALKGQILFEQAEVKTGTTLTVQAGQDIKANVMSSGTDTSVTAGGQAQIASLSSGGKAELNIAGNADMTSVQTDGDVTADVTGNIDLASLQAKGDVSLTVGGQADITSLTTEKDATLTIAGNTDIDTLSGQNITLTVQNGTTSVSEMTAGNDIELQTSGQNTVLTQVTAGGNVQGTVLTGNLSVENMTADRDISFDAQNGDFTIGKMSAQNGQINLAAENGFINAKTNEITLQAQTVNLTDVGKDIGSQTRPMKVQANDLNAFADKDIYLFLKSLDDTAQDSHFGTISSKDGNIYLKAENENALLSGVVSAEKGHLSIYAENSIKDIAQNEEGTLRANTLSLTGKKGTIGSQDAYIQVDSSATEDGWVDAKAAQGIFINEKKGPLNIRSFEVTEGDLKMHIDSTIQGVKVPKGQANITAQNIELHSNKGSIGIDGRELVLSVNDALPGHIDLLAATGISFEKTSPDLWSNYMIVTQNGKIKGVFPSGHDRIGILKASGGVNFIFFDGGKWSNLWVAKKDIESKLLDPVVVHSPAHSTVQPHETPFGGTSYTLQYKGITGQRMEQKDWQEYFLELSLNN